MIIKKVFETGVDISRIDLFTKPDVNIMNILVDRFEGYCYKSCFIRKILQIIRRSECVIDQDGLEAFGKISVQFEAEVEVLLSGEIINGCKVEKKNAYGVMICTRENLVVGITPNPLFNSIAEGQFISIRIIGCKYQIGQPRITAQAEPYMYQNGSIYHITNAITQDDIEYFGPALANADAEEANFKKITSGREAFTTLIAAYSKPQKPPAGAKEIKITDRDEIAKLKDVYIIRDYRADLSTPAVYCYNNLADVQKAYPDIEINEQMTNRGAVLNVIHDYINHIRTIREMTEVYNTPELFESHKNLWKIFKKMKIQ
jgi:hypothetical protein